MTEEQTGTGPSRWQLSRRSMLAGVAAVAATPAAATAAASPAVADPGNGRGNPDRGKNGDPHHGETREITMYAEELSDGMIGYGLNSGEATVPGPVLEIWEGDTLEISLVNNTDKQLSIHPHGVDYDVDSDGTPLNDSYNEPGETRTYVWPTHGPRHGERGTWMPGSAGYWHYHDHAMGTPHGTEGIRRGLYGALIVRRKGDVLPERQFTIVFNDMTINNRTAPDAPLLEARLGERAEFICIGHGDLFHTFHTHAHRWVDNRTGMLDGPNDPTRAIDNKDLNPGSSFGFQVIAGQGVGPGAWMYHCHVQFHSDQGMSGIFLVRDADGSVPEHARAALERYRGAG